MYIYTIMRVWGGIGVEAAGALPTPLDAVAPVRAFANFVSFGDAATDCTPAGHIFVVG